MSQLGPAVTAGNSTLHDVARRIPGRVLGIDVGGSGTRVILLQNGTVTHRPDGPPMNALYHRLRRHIRQIIEAADATAAGVGMPGFRLLGQARDLSEALTRQTGCPVHVTGDAASARPCTPSGAPGVVVIAGTGSIASGWNGESSARAGGHGFLLGDEGSAYWIGRAAVRAALRWEDGMSGGSELIHRAVIQAAGQGLDALIGEVCTHPAERDRLTALAPVVTALAAEDPEARKIALRGRRAPRRPGRGHPRADLPLIPRPAAFSGIEPLLDRAPDNRTPWPNGRGSNAHHQRDSWRFCHEPGARPARRCASACQPH